MVAWLVAREQAGTLPVDQPGQVARSDLNWTTLLAILS